MCDDRQENEPAPSRGDRNNPQPLREHFSHKNAWTLTSVLSLGGKNLLMKDLDTKVCNLTHDLLPPPSKALCSMCDYFLVSCFLREGNQLTPLPIMLPTLPLSRYYLFQKMG